MMADDDRLCADLRAFYGILHAQHAFYHKGQFRHFHIGTQHIRGLYRHLFADYHVQTFRSEDMVNVHSYAKRPDTLRILHLVEHFGMVCIRLYDTHGFGPGIHDLFKLLVFHHAAEV